MKKILLIKTGAAGDVVRTTVLLRTLQGQITWLIDDRYSSILPSTGEHPHLQRIIPFSQAQELLREHFDMIISLEENEDCARLAASIPHTRLLGIYSDNGNMQYTSDAAGWFDMSLLSNHGAAKANELKMQNLQTFQYWLFRMIGKEFAGETYDIYQHDSIRPADNLIGLEKRAGDRWPNKGWGGYAKLQRLLEQQGYTCKVLQQRNHLREYMDDIAGCAYIVSGDTLSMHIAMAYNIPCTALFNCTSPAEIYDYGLLQKIINPMLNANYYSRTYDKAIVDGIPARQVFEAVREHYLSHYALQKA